VLALPCLLYSMDLTVLYIGGAEAERRPAPEQRSAALDHRHLRLHARRPAPDDGSLGDRIGRRRLLLIGAGAFGATSLLAAFSTSAPMLIAARALLGIAGATLAPSTLSLLRGMFADQRQRTFAIGV